MKLVFAAMIAVGFAAFAAAPASAQEVMQTWSPSEMKSILASLDAKVTEEGKTEEGEPDLDVESSEGLKFHIYGAECEKIGGIDRCSGAEFAAIFNLEDQEDVDEALTKLDYAAVSYFDAEDGDLKVTRYLIFDKGVTRGNVEVNAKVFLNICHEIWDMLDDEGYFDN